MTTKDIVRKLNKLCPEEYYVDKLFEGDRRVYARRSLTDLNTYFKRWNVSEKQLLRALKKAGFVVRICGDIRKCITFKSKDRVFLPIADPKSRYPGYYTFADTHIELETKFTEEYFKKNFNYDL